jgi:acyl-CoA synthetase (AMP-forming)/AMP-acid ligase II
MNIMLLLEMAAGAAPDRLALGERADGLSYERLYGLAGQAAAEFQTLEVERVVYAAESSPALPVALFGAAWAGLPFVPVNYRLADDRLRSIAERQVPAVLLCDAGTEDRFAGIDGLTLVTVGGFLTSITSVTGITGLEPMAPEWSQDPEDVAVLLHTSGTSGEPKAAVLRHRHLTNYVLGAVEFLGAGDDEASLVSVPPYHIAGISAILTSVYGGRRLVQLPSFSPDEWVFIARRERITHAMTVPTMLSRILDELDPATKGDGQGLPSVRHLSYGGGRMPVPVITRALSLLPGVDFVNAYGLTETSSSIAVLTPDDHRQALASDEPHIRNRLGSVGQPLPTVEITVRDRDGGVVAPNTRGEIWVRGEQVSGEYHGKEGSGPGEGWFATNDEGYFDDSGYLYVDGRLDDVIVRGGENLSPGEIEDVLLEHPVVRDCAVVGIRDEEWGEVVAAVVVPHVGRVADEQELSDFVVSHLRSSRRPAVIDIRSSLPVSDTGKVLKRILRDELAAQHQGAQGQTGNGQKGRTP